MLNCSISVSRQRQKNFRLRGGIIFYLFKQAKQIFISLQASLCKFFAVKFFGRSVIVFGKIHVKHDDFCSALISDVQKLRHFIARRQIRLSQCLKRFVIEIQKCNFLQGLICIRFRIHTQHNAVIQPAIYKTLAYGSIFYRQEKKHHRQSQ